MSQYITSYTKDRINQKDMGLHFSKFKFKWQFVIIPVIRLYFESHDPSNHRRIWQTGFSGLYLSIEWLRWSFTFGIFKKP